MNGIRNAFRSGRLLTVAAIFVIAIVALVAIPLVAAAGDRLSDRHGKRGPQTVAQCRERVAAEDPRRDNFLDELVTDAVISADQAAEIDTRMDARHFDGCVTRILFKRGTAIRATASATEVEPREVLGALVAGQSLSEFANEHGVDDASLVIAIMAAPEAQAAELISTGDVSQAEIDAILAQIEERVTAAIQRTDLSPRGFDQHTDEVDGAL